MSNRPEIKFPETPDLSDLDQAFIDRVEIHPAETIDTREARRREMRVNFPAWYLEFHVTIGGPGSVAVTTAWRAATQREAEDAAMRWARNVWFRDKRELTLIKTELVEE